ncbi:MAG: DUF4926 domain-containing protein [Sulfuricella sp.]|nr:DUF4926 domain-containing protein [Sulfuricella sp.]
MRNKLLRAVKETLDVVALTEDLPENKLQRGQAGTIVEMLGQDVYEVEFCDLDGRAYASAAVPAPRLMVLHHAPARLVV